MSPIHYEASFSDAIVAAMLERGWREGCPQDYRADFALDTGDLFAFIGATQIAEWNELLSLYGNDPNAAQLGFAKRLDQSIAIDGLLDVLRNGVKDRGVRIRVAYFRPNLVMSDSVLDKYRANRLAVVRELPYATRQADAGHRLDLALFLNGIPIATAELKNPLTGQGVEQAKEQYRSDRDPTELIFTRAYSRELRSRPGPGVRDDQASRSEDRVPAVQHRFQRSRPVRRCRQPVAGRARRVRDFVPVGADLAARQLA